MNPGRCLGLIGGLGVGATVHYYEKLAKTHEELGRTLNIVITHAQIGRVREYVEADDRAGLAEYLIAFIRRMKTAGAEIAAIPYGLKTRPSVSSTTYVHVSCDVKLQNGTLPTLNQTECGAHLSFRAIRG